MHVNFGVAAGALAPAAVVAVLWLPGRIDVRTDAEGTTRDTVAQPNATDSPAEEAAR